MTVKINKQLVLNLISKGESETVEFKASFDQAAIETIVAFANTKGGYVIIGVIIEKYGSGIKRIMAAFRLYNMPEPMFEEIQNGFRVTIFKTTQKTTQKISTRERIYEELKLNPKITREELANKLGKSVSTIKEHLSGLKSKDRVERIGSDRDGYWQVK